MKKIICFLIGHKYKVLRRVFSDYQEEVCTRCKKEFAHSIDIGFRSELTGTLRRIASEAIEIRKNIKP